MPEQPELGAGPRGEPAPPNRADVDWHHPHVADMRRAILNDLRASGPSSPDELCRRVGTSRSAVVQHLRALEAAGIVRRETVRHGVGRPRHVYDVTPIAQGLFPTNYDGLATDMLAAILAVGGDDLVRDVFEERRRAVAERVRGRLAERLAPDATLGERVRELAVIQDEQGYLCAATASEDGRSYRIEEHNCAIYHVAAGQPSACLAELELFSDVLGVEVVRETHIMAGDRCCSYRVVEA